MSQRGVGVLFACFAIIFVHYAIRYSYGTLLPEMLPALSITKAEAGMIYSSYFITYTALSPVLGMLSDRYDVRIILTLFVMLMGAGAFLMATSTSQLQASIFFGVAGVGCSACWAPVMALAQRWTPEGRRGMSLAFVDAGSSLGVMATGAVTPLIVAAYDWQAGWMSLGVLAFILAIVTFFFVQSDPKAKASPSSHVEGKRRLTGITYKELFCNASFWLIGMAYLFTGFAIMIPFAFISTYAVQELSLPYDSATRLVTLIGMGGVTGKLVLGPLSDTLGRIKVLVISAVLIAGGNLAMAYSRGWMLVVVTFVFGFGYGACWAMYAACASDFFSRQAAGGIIGLWTVFLGVGFMVSPSLAGWVADATGTFMWSFLIAAAGGVASLLLLLPMLRVDFRTAAK
jgi:MFS family permease